MRATPQEQKGGAGVHEVAANFERIGWGPAENPHHDLGTDLYLALRDDRLVELGLIAGAQVKAGPSYFEEPELGEAGEVIGWWYRESRRNHFDYWIQGGFNRSSQHLDFGGVRGWRRATGARRPAMRRRGFVVSGVLIGR